jgi:hypothetical protein
MLFSPSLIVQGRNAVVPQKETSTYLPIIFNTLILQIIPTRFPTPTQTRTPTRTRTPFRSSTPRPTSTQTPTQTLTPTTTNTPTLTPTTTLIPLPTITISFPSHTPSITPSPTVLPTITSTPFPSLTLFGNPQSSTWIVIILLTLLWVILAVWLYLLLRRRT